VEYFAKQRIFLRVTEYWYILMAINLYYLIFYFDTIFENRFILPVSFIVLILFKSIFNALFNYRKALKRKLILGRETAEFIYFARQTLKKRRYSKKIKQEEGYD